MNVVLSDYRTLTVNFLKVAEHQVQQMAMSWQSVDSTKMAQEKQYSIGMLILCNLFNQIIL